MTINKNTLIAICLILIGWVVLYQFLFKFVFPIALLWVLLYILKLLIKGENDEEVKEYKSIQDNSDFTSHGEILEPLEEYKEEAIPDSEAVVSSEESEEEYKEEEKIDIDNEINFDSK